MPGIVREDTIVSIFNIERAIAKAWFRATLGFPMNFAIVAALATSPVSRRGFGRVSALAACVAPMVARAGGIFEGAPGFSGGDSAEKLGSSVLKGSQALGIKPREAVDQRPVDDLTKRLLQQSEDNRAKNEAAIYRRTLLNGEGARLFPGDGLTVFEDGVPAEISMPEYEALMESGRIVRGSRDLLPAKK